MKFLIHKDLFFEKKYGVWETKATREWEVETYQLSYNLRDSDAFRSFCNHVRYSRNSSRMSRSMNIYPSYPSIVLYFTKHIVTMSNKVAAMLFSARGDHSKFLNLIRFKYISRTFPIKKFKWSNSSFQQVDFHFNFDWTFSIECFSSKHWV